MSRFGRNVTTHTDFGVIPLVEAGPLAHRCTSPRLVSVHPISLEISDTQLVSVVIGQSTNMREIRVKNGSFTADVVLNEDALILRQSGQSTPLRELTPGDIIMGMPSDVPTTLVIETINDYGPEATITVETTGVLDHIIIDHIICRI